MLFAVLHSVLAMKKLKASLFNAFPFMHRWYRLLYNVISIILLALWVMLIPTENIDIYAFSTPWNFVFHAVQIASLLGLLKTVQSFDTSAFLGLKQISSSNPSSFHLDEVGIEPLITQGIYKYIRHPLYTFSMGVLLFHPYMTLRLMIMSILIVAYFWIGSYFEEMRLLDKYGDQYKNYRIRTGRFIPSMKALSSEK